MFRCFYDKLDISPLWTLFFFSILTYVIYRKVIPVVVILFFMFYLLGVCPKPPRPQHSRIRTINRSNTSSDGNFENKSKRTQPETSSNVISNASAIKIDSS